MPLQTLSEQAIISPLHLLNLLRLINARSASSSFPSGKDTGTGRKSDGVQWEAYHNIQGLVGSQSVRKHSGSLQIDWIIS